MSMSAPPPPSFPNSTFTPSHQAPHQAPHQSPPSTLLSLCFRKMKSPLSSQPTPHRKSPPSSASPTSAWCSTKPHPLSLPHSQAHYGKLCKAVTAVTRPSTSKKHPRSPSPLEAEKESQIPVQSSLSQESLREASPPNCPLSLSLDPASPLQRDALLRRRDL